MTILLFLLLQEMNKSTYKKYFKFYPDFSYYIHFISLFLQYISFQSAILCNLFSLSNKACIHFLKMLIIKTKKLVKL